MNFQGKSKRNYDAAEFMAFVGVAGAAVSIFCYIIYLIFLFNA
jgi:hypothetical protein